MSGPLSYIGGKNRIAGEIIKIFPGHTTYVEPFAGGAQVFFRKQRSQVEVLNDLDGDIVNFFRICQLHYEEFLRYLRFTLVSRRWFSSYVKQEPEMLTDIQRAVRFYYVQKNAFAGLVRTPRYAHSVTGPRPFNPGRVPELIEKAHQRLARVQIENLPYEEILKRFDRPTTLFYLDPPYYGRALYRFNFKREDFVALEERLKDLQGKFILSLNDLPEVRAIFKRFQFREITLHYTAQPKAGKRYPELLITNFS